MNTADDEVLFCLDLVRRSSATPEDPPRPRRVPGRDWRTGPPPTTCGIEDCGRPHHGKALCLTHYRARRRELYATRTPEQIERDRIADREKKRRRIRQKPRTATESQPRLQATTTRTNRYASHLRAGNDDQFWRYAIVYPQNADGDNR